MTKRVPGHSAATVRMWVDMSVAPGTGAGLGGVGGVVDRVRAHRVAAERGRQRGDERRPRMPRPGVSPVPRAKTTSTSLQVAACALDVPRVSRLVTARAGTASTVARRARRDDRGTGSSWGRRAAVAESHPFLGSWQHPRRGCPTIDFWRRARENAPARPPPRGRGTQVPRRRWSPVSSSPPAPDEHLRARLRDELRHRLRPMRGRDPHERDRATTPIELLYDLTYVIAFGAAAEELAHQVAEGHVGAGRRGVPVRGVRGHLGLAELHLVLLRLRQRRRPVPGRDDRADGRGRHPDLRPAGELRAGRRGREPEQHAAGRRLRRHAGAADRAVAPRRPAGPRAPPGRDRVRGDDHRRAGRLGADRGAAPAGRGDRRRPRPPGPGRDGRPGRRRAALGAAAVEPRPPRRTVQPAHPHHPRRGHRGDRRRGRRADGRGGLVRRRRRDRVVRARPRGRAVVGVLPRALPRGPARPGRTGSSPGGTPTCRCSGRWPRSAPGCAWRATRSSRASWASSRSRSRSSSRSSPWS